MATPTVAASVSAPTESTPVHAAVEGAAVTQRAESGQVQADPVERLAGSRDRTTQGIALTVCRKQHHGNLWPVGTTYSV